MSVCCPFCLVIILSANTTTPRPPPATRVLLITHSQLQLGLWISIILWTPVGVILIFQRCNHGNSVWRAKPGELADCRDVMSSSRKQISHNAVIWRKTQCKWVCVEGGGGGFLHDWTSVTVSRWVFIKKCEYSLVCPTFVYRVCFAHLYVQTPNPVKSEFLIWLDFSQSNQFQVCLDDELGHCVGA